MKINFQCKVEPAFFFENFFCFLPKKNNIYMAMIIKKTEQTNDKFERETILSKINSIICHEIQSNGNNNNKTIISCICGSNIFLCCISTTTTILVSLVSHIWKLRKQKNNIYKLPLWFGVVNEKKQSKHWEGIGDWYITND